MSNITKFAGYPSSDGTFLNYAGPVTLSRYSGTNVPSNAKIIKVTFSFYSEIWSGVSDNFYVYDLSSKSKPSNNGNYWTDSDGAPRISTATNITASDGDMEDRYYFSGVSSDHENYDALVNLVTNTSSFTICFCRARYRNPSTSTGTTGYLFASKAYYCSVEWEDTDYQPTLPTPVIIDNSQVAPGGSVSITWTPSRIVQSDATNSIVGYSIEIYDENDYSTEASGPYSPENATLPYYLEGANLSSHTFQAPTRAGTYICRIETVTRDSDGSLSWWTNDGATASFSVVNVGSTGDPSNLRINNTTSLYIGTENIPNLNFTWTAAAVGTNNPVKSYSLYQNNSAIWEDIGGTSVTYYNTAGRVGSYKVYAQPTVSGYGSTTGSNSVTITQITTKPTISFTRTYSGTLNNDFVLSWNAASAINNATATYYIYRGNTLLTSTTSTSYNFDISSVAAGTSFTLSVEPRYVTASGSYTAGTKITTGTLVRAASFDVPTSFWMACYDSGNGFTEGLYNHAHEIISLKWKNITASVTTGTSFTYVLEEQIDGGAFSPIGTYNAPPDRFDRNITSVTEGTILGYRVKITNNYGITAYSSTHTVTKIISPKIKGVNVSNINYTSMQITFNWDYGSLTFAEDTKGLTYIIELEHNEQHTILHTGTINNTTSATITDTYNISLASLRSKLPNLYTEVITNRKVYPKGKINLFLTQGSYETAGANSSLDFTFNYVTMPDYTNTTITYEIAKNYYNPGEQAKILLNGFVWEDAAGGTTGGIVTNYLASSYSTNKFNFINNSTTVTAPEASEDLNIILTLKTSIAYAEVTKEYTTTITLPFEVARWVAETVLIESLNLIADNNPNTQDYLEGYIKLPERLCSSQNYDNLNTITLAVISPSSGYTTTFYNNAGATDTSLIVDEIPADYRVKFKLQNSSQKYTDVTARFNLTFTNKAGQSLVIETNSYRYFLADIDMAVRKGRVGINVGADFASNSKDSTLQINAGTQTGNDNPIVEIISPTTSNDNISTIFMSLKDQTLTTPINIWTNGSNLFIDKLLISGLTGDRVLISDSSGKLTTSSSITTTELEFLNGLTENIGTSLGKKQNTINGAASTITSSNLTTNRALISNGSGKVAVSAITSTELSCLDGVTDNIQEQLNAKYTLPGTVNANQIFASPDGSNGTPSFRALVSDDIPSLSFSKITGTLSVGKGGTGSTTKGAASGGALYNLGIVYSATGTSGVSSPTAGMICLVPKG